MSIISVSKTYGARVAARIKSVAENTCFRHTGIVNADPEAVSWNKQRQSAGPAYAAYTVQKVIDCCPGATAVHDGETDFLAVLTDGSARCMNSAYLAHGGWGTFVADNSAANRGGALIGLPVTSYRSEVAAMADAIVRSGTRVCVVSDCQSAVPTLQRILGDGGTKDHHTRLRDGCEEFWQIIKEVAGEHPPGHHQAR